MLNLPIDFLRSFVAIVNAGSILRASEHVFLTPSALSLQVKRLEEILQTPLFYRGGRQITPTPAGKALLAFAREILELNDRAVLSLTGDRFVGPIRIGLVQDFADTFLGGLLASFARANPEARMDVRIAGSAELIALFNSERLDIVACLSDAESSNAVVSAPMLWFGYAALMKEAVLPVALMEQPCVFREAATRVLEASKVAYRVAMETSSLSALRAAVSSGIAVTCRTSGFSEHVLNGPETFHLPPLPLVGHSILAKANPHPTLERLVELLRASMLDRID